VDLDAPSAQSEELLERRVLLLPPTRRDAQAIGAVLSAAGIACRVYGSMSQVCGALAAGAGAIVVSEEAIAADSDELIACLSRQPVWADLPVIVLSRSGSESPKLTGLLAKIGNVSVVERPVRISTLLSVVRVAIRGRERQYEVREHLRHLRAVEAERTALWESERAARADAERASRMKDEFLATLSHEIRTPLSAIIGWIHILEAGPANEQDLERGLEVIKRNAKSQSQIVADLLDMNRIINGKLRLDIKRIQLAPVVQAAVDTVVPAADAKGIRLRVTLDPLAGSISGDAERLQQVFWNLLSNAVKFTPGGEHVHVHLERVDDHVQVRIADSGEGIDGEFLPHVFDRFSQADGSTTRRHGGLGLGLAIVKQLVELHGGAVRAESPGRGRGSTFTVVLPRAGVRADDTQPSQAAHSSGESGSPSLRRHDHIAGVRVLVVDDEPDSRDLVKRLLDSGGAVVTTAPSAHDALETIRRWRPDVLISDIGMPGEDGYSLIRAVRALAEDAGGKTVAIALTAYARAEDRVAALKAGFQHHMSKPVDPGELIAVVASAFRPPDGGR
jgi:signal transduction histidine kinase/ActR/RegA family two-component response regulator